MAGLFDIGTIDKLEIVRNKRPQENETNASHSESNFRLFSLAVFYWRRSMMTRAAFRLF